MPDPKPLTRKELSTFLPDQRAVRAFEELFNIVPSEVESNTSELIGLSSKTAESNAMAAEAIQIALFSNTLLWLST